MKKTIIAIFILGMVLGAEYNTQGRDPNYLEWDGETGLSHGDSRFEAIVSEVTDTGIFSVYELLNWGIDIGYNNPEMNIMLLSTILLGILILPRTIYVLAFLYVILTWIKKKVI